MNTFILKQTFALAIMTLFYIDGFSQKAEQISSTDTFKLFNPVFKQTLQYKNGDATIYIDYRLFKKKFDKFWNEYKRYKRTYTREYRKNPALANKEWHRVWIFLDSMHTLFAAQVKRNDTVTIREWEFTNVGIGTGYNFDTQIENGQCTIMDHSGRQQTIIIRQRRHYQRDFLDGWGGRRYYFPGARQPFYSATDWIS